ncbi:MAG: long-chain fatty acid transport protein [Myxococcota bacterium]|jgi:long-chain fatty acid transport protein
MSLLGASFGAPSAWAGGYDTPILYSAEHMGMGGAAISYVDDPSAMFHNPAGLARTHGLTLMANASILFGTITSTPTDFSGTVESEGILSVAPLIGASYRFSDVFAAGIALYPVAAAGAEYFIEAGNEVLREFTQVTFIEISPGVAFKLPGNVRLGLGYRISLVSLDRIRKSTTNPNNVTFDSQLSGANFAGFRLGVNWDPIPELQLGFVYRHKTDTTIDTDKGDVPVQRDVAVETDFVLPTQLGFGARVNLKPISFLLDLQYTLQSENDELVFKTTPPSGLVINSVFKWLDNVTVRAGVEYQVEASPTDVWMFRGGFIYDGQVNREEYPSAFGTPPTGTTTITGGIGYEHAKTWKANLAFAHRSGSATVRQSVIDAADADRNCLACSEGGDYNITLTGIYLDFAYSFL